MPQKLFPIAGFCLILFLTGCVTSGGGGYTRSPVVTAQSLICGEEPNQMPATLTLHSPAEATLRFSSTKYELRRKTVKNGIMFKSKHASIWKDGVRSIIEIKAHKDGIYNCQSVPAQDL